MLFRCLTHQLNILTTQLTEEALKVQISVRAAQSNYMNWVTATGWSLSHLGILSMLMIAITTWGVTKGISAVLKIWERCRMKCSPIPDPMLVLQSRAYKAALQPTNSSQSFVLSALFLSLSLSMRISSCSLMQRLLSSWRVSFQRTSKNWPQKSTATYSFSSRRQRVMLRSLTALLYMSLTISQFLR